MRVGSLKTIRVVWMLLLTVGCASVGFAQTFTTYGGEATAVSGTVAGIPVNLASTGAIDPNGGARNNSLVCYPGGPQCYVGVPDATSGLLSAQTLAATTIGRGDTTYAHSSVANLSLSVHGLLIEAHYVQSDAKSVCKDDGHGGKFSESKGRSEFSHLTVGGIPIAVSGLPNQLVTVASPLGSTITIVINEQTVSNGYLTVRALRVKGPSIFGVVNASDVSVAMVKTKIDCGDVDGCFAEKVTSGGFVRIAGGKLTFAASGKNLSDWGHFVAVNHVTGEKLKAVIQTTTFTSDGFATIVGKATVDGSAVPLLDFVLRLRDEDEPGRDDEFELFTTDPSFLVPLTTLDGGNIQFHKPKGDCPLPEPPDLCEVAPNFPGCDDDPPPEEEAPPVE